MVANSQPDAGAAATANANATTNAAAGAAASAQKRDVYVTGFGRFGDILENPTTFLAKKLAEHPKVTEAHVLEVAAESCVEELGMMHARAEGRGRPCIFLHFGVSAIARTLKLEQVGYNVADFRIPDERGYVAKDEVIHEGEPDEIVTKVPLEELLPTLQAVHPRIALSTDPGRYICNFVYFRSLVWVKRQAAKGHSEHLALFVHVPEFRNVVFEDQVALASKIVDLVADL
ncbi:putative cysteine protease family C15 [Phytophthora cinnamomi]|uniref:putative cysteine protease family C15 n=1 Tax=Phytophthora cinnamomi TaxID=4785 RepID=UPI00355973B8|nr:putative cysteine protease family C15 [Phytophthora cinnamomi]